MKYTYEVLDWDEIYSPGIYFFFIIKDNVPILESVPTFYSIEEATEQADKLCMILNTGDK